MVTLYTHWMKIQPTGIEDYHKQSPSIIMDQNQLSPTITNHNQVSSNMLIKLLQSYLSTMTHQLPSTMEDSDLSTRRHARVSVASMMDVLVQSLSVAAPTIRNCSPKLRPAWALWEPEPWCGDILGAIFRHQSNSKNMCSSCVLKRSETFILSIYRYINYPPTPADARGSA